MKTYRRIEFIERAVKNVANEYFDRKITACDVGTDHGYIAESLAKQDYVECVYATDKSAKSLKKLENLLKFQPNLNIFAFFGDGITPIKNVDVTVIAGIGGVEIIKILSTQNKQDDGKNKCDFFVLQPAQNVVELREFLIQKRICVLSDKLVLDEDRFYSVITIDVSKRKKLKRNIYNLYLGRDNNLENEGFRRLLIKTDVFLKYLDDIPLKRIKCDRVLFEKYKLKKLVKKLLVKGETYVR